MRINKEQIIGEIAKESGLTKWRTRLFLQVFADVIIEHLVKGDEVNICRFGKFYTKKLKPHKLNTVRTNGEMIIPERDKIKFKSSKLLKEFELY